MRASDVVPATLMLALCAAIAFDTRRLSFWDETTPGPAFLPVWLAIAGAVLFLLRLAEARRARAAPPQWPDAAASGRIAKIFGAIVAVPLLAPWLGLIPALALLVLFVVWFVLRQRLGPSLVTTAITTGLIYLVFVVWLGVALPKSPFGL